MKPSQILILGACLLPLAVAAGSRTSANYSVPADTADAGGRRITSAAYTIDASIGGIGGIGTVSTTTAKHSYAGQIYDARTLAISAVPASVDEGANRQLSAAIGADDGTILAGAVAGVAWNVVSGPLASINPAGLATAGAVYQNTLATVDGSYLGLSNTFGLLVLNVDPDNFDAYAGDGLDDAWQVQYFGIGNPNAGPGNDPDGDGQTNQFEYVAGTVPTNSLSLFRLRIENVPERPTFKNLIFSPLVEKRTYTPEYRINAALGLFAPLVGPDVNDVGIERTVTDREATDDARFYRVGIALP